MYDFDYYRPGSLEEAGKLIASDREWKLLAGGMSLVPSLKLRLAKYPALVDLGAIRELKGIRREEDTLIIGAMTEHATVAAAPEVIAAIPALAVLAGGIGDPLVRNRGTLGGSIANADPAADYPAGLVGLGATICTIKRTIPADEFFLGLFETALGPGEIITAVRFPIPERAGYAKLPQPASRYPLVGAMVAKTGKGMRVAITGAAPAVFRWKEAETRLAQQFAPPALDGIEIDAEGLNSDIHASAEYRAHCVGIMTKRAVLTAR